MATSFGTYLSSDSVRTSREELRDASSLESALSETDGGTETRASSTDDDGVVLVVNNLIGRCDVGLGSKRIIRWLEDAHIVVEARRRRE